MKRPVLKVSLGCYYIFLSLFLYFLLLFQLFWSVESIGCKGSGKWFYMQKDALDEKEGVKEGKKKVLLGRPKQVCYSI